MRSHVRLSAVATLLALMLARPSNGAWQPEGVPLSPLPTGLQANLFLALVADGSHGAYALWEYQETDPIDYTYRYAHRVQRVDVLGNRPAPWPAAGSSIRTWQDNSVIGTYGITPIALLENGSGGAVEALLDQTFIVEYMTLFRLYGVAPNGVSTAISLQNSTFGGYPVIMAATDGDGGGGAVMIGLQQTFSQPPNPRPPSPLYAQRVNAAGAPLWPEVAGTPGVELNTVGQTEPSGAAALSDGAGGGFFAWIERREPADPDLYVQHLDAAGAVAPGWPPGGVLVCGANGSQSALRLVPAGAGGVVVVWRDERSGVARLYGHVVLAGGTPDPGIPADGRQLPSSDPSDDLANLASDMQGGCFVARRGSGGIFRLCRVDGALLPRSGWPGEGIALNTLATGTVVVGLAPDGLGGAYVSFRNGFFGTALPQGLFAQHYAANGNPAPGWAATPYRLSGTGQESAVVRSADGAIVAWNDTRTAYRGVYAQRLIPDGPVAALLALVSARASGRSVALRWYSADGPALSATLERSVDGAGWAFLAALTADGTGILEYVDAAVEPGTRYGYRLVWRDGETTRTGGEGWIVVPRDLGLALEAPSPNPSSGAVTLAIMLPDARGARLEVLDLAGRRVAARELGGLTAGRHAVPLPEVQALAPGLYILRLTHAGAERRARLVRVD